MANIKNPAFVLGLAFMMSCTQRDNVENPTTTRSNDNVNLVKIRPVGSELFKLIRDTVSVKPMTSALLANNDWEFYPEDKCISSYSFKSDLTGTGYNCEGMEQFEIKYLINKDTLYISQFEPASIDTAKESIKTRDEKFVYNGSSLVLIDSKMYSEDKVWTPESGNISKGFKGYYSGLDKELNQLIDKLNEI